MKKIFKLVLVLFTFVFIGLISFWGIVVYISSDLPQINSLEDYRPPMNSQILSRDGEVLLDIGKETREVVDFKKIPPLIVGAFLSAEDDKFYEHKGVDYLGLLRAFIVNFKEGRVVQGGSTITQQVAKSLLLSKERTITRKIKDFLLARKIEEKFSKDDILFLYLNQIYLGGGYYGIKAAFKGYFDKELDQASIAESALIAGLLVAPGRYSPYINPKFAKMRQGYVLRRMFETGKINEEEYKNAKEEKIKMKIRNVSRLKGGHFTDWIRQVVAEKVGNEEFLSMGFKVVTTLDWSIQEKAEQAVKKHVKEVDRRQGYKGPLGKITESEKDQFLQMARDKIYREKSTYFYFDTDGKNVFEYSSGVDEFLNLTAQKNQEQEKINIRYKEKIVLGLTDDDPLLKVLEKDHTYTAIVTKVDDSMRIVFVSVAGVEMIIPEAGFSWAHERIEDENEKYYAPISKPSTILKVGDQISVKYISPAASLWSYVSSDFKKKNKDPEFVKLIQSQLFLVGELDQVPETEGSFIAINSQNGQILSLVGGIDFQKSQFNRALQAARQPGSSFKPFIYACALENGYSPTSIVLDSPQALGGVDDDLSWKPKNYDGQFMGPMTFRRALEVSRNIPTIRILQDVGVERITECANRFGIKANFPRDLSISLGSFGISLAELVKAFAIFGNGGKKIDLQSILSVKDFSGKKYELKTEVLLPEENKIITEETKIEEKPLEENIFLKNLNGNQVYDPRLAFIMTNLLKGVVTNGTATLAKSLGGNIAGKTGTTNNYVDALFIGYSSHVVAGSWVGLDNNKSMGYGETGGKTALPIWIEVMGSILGKYGNNDFEMPEGVTQKLINRETGKSTSSTDPVAFMETFVDGIDNSQSQSDTNGEENASPPQVLEGDDYYLNQ